MEFMLPRAYHITDMFHATTWRDAPRATHDAFLLLAAGMQPA